MSMTLAESAKLYAGDPKKAGIIELFGLDSDILGAMKFENIVGSGIDYDQEQTLPGIGFRGINQDYDEGVGVINPQHDPLKIAGGDLDVDKALIKMHGIAQRTKHERMKIKALSLKIAKTIIKGDSGSDPREFYGLQSRLTGNQKICVTTNTTDSVGALTLAKMDALIDAVENPTHLIMNKTVRRLLTAASRSSSVDANISYGRDAFGRRLTMYADLPILIAGKDNTGTEIIPNTETAGDAGSDATSVYCVSIGDGMLMGIQNGDMDVTDLGELDTSPVYRTRIEWLVGMALYHPYAAARLWNISTATAVTA